MQTLAAQARPQGAGTAFAGIHADSMRDEHTEYVMEHLQGYLGEYARLRRGWMAPNVYQPTRLGSLCFVHGWDTVQHTIIDHVPNQRCPDVRPDT